MSCNIVLFRIHGFIINIKTSIYKLHFNIQPPLYSLYQKQLKQVLTYKHKSRFLKHGS